MALDLNSGKPRLCLLKQGRPNGEVTWDGRDGAWRVRNEQRVLDQLKSFGVPVPRVQSSFELDGNYYLIMEYLNGETLHEKLLSRSRRMTIAQVVYCGQQVARFIAQLHQAGWAWRDCKPMNIIVTSNGRLVPIDFEGAAPIDHPDPIKWGTPGFTAPASHHRIASNGVAEDLYALGSILFLLLTGVIYDPQRTLTIKASRRNVPTKLAQLIESLLSSEAGQRPTIRTAQASLAVISKSLRRRQLKRVA